MKVDSGMSSSNWLRYLSMVSDSITLRNQISKWKIQGAQSGFGGMEVLEDFITSWVLGPFWGVGRAP